MKEEYAEYFERLTQPPRLLVGQEVQSLTGDGKEKLRDANDAREWQEAAKHLLAAEVDARAARRADELRDVFDTVHSSIDLFRNNVDLIPGTKQFDKELADKFAELASDYALKSNDKIIGYSVPVQPMINQLRSQLAAARAAKAAAAAPAQAPAAPAAPSARAQQVANQPRTPTGQWDSPQAGVSSKAGQSSDTTSEGEGVLNAFFRQNGQGGFTF